MKKVLIFCGANAGFDEKYTQAAIALGKALVKRNIHVITGAGSVGLMGVIANAVLEAGGTITGVIPTFLDKMEVGHKGLTETIVTETMHERKELMHQLCDSIIAMPGGYGTFDELFETLTWAQLQLHQKPTGLLNVDGFYDHLLTFLDHIVDEGFLKQNNRNLLLSDSDIDGLLDKMADYQPNTDSKWIV